MQISITRRTVPLWQARCGFGFVLPGCLRTLHAIPIALGAKTFHTTPLRLNQATVAFYLDAGDPIWSVFGSGIIIKGRRRTMIARRISANNVVKADGSITSPLGTGQPVQLSNVATGSQDF